MTFNPDEPREHLRKLRLELLLQSVDRMLSVAIIGQHLEKVFDAVELVREAKANYDEI